MPLIFGICITFGYRNVLPWGACLNSSWRTGNPKLCSHPGCEVMPSFNVPGQPATQFPNVAAYSHPPQPSEEKHCKVYQTKYGKRMVPDQKLSRLLSEVCRLPEEIDKSPDQRFVPEINSKGLHGTLHVFSHDEALIVALLSLREQSFHQILNRFKTRTMERKQNRAMAFAPTWLIEIIHDRLVQRNILNPLFFKKEYIPYSSVWIDSNTSCNFHSIGGPRTEVAIQTIISKDQS
jgi:hypothetical protein